jgi:hypothetical protein
MTNSWASFSSPRTPASPRLPNKMRGVLLGEPTCEPVRCQQRPPVVWAVEVDLFSPVLRGPRGMEDRAC